MIKWTSVFVLILAQIAMLNGQMSSYEYKRSINGIAQSWHSLILPDSLFDKLNPDLTDLRIYTISPKDDTLEIPYVLVAHIDKIEKKPGEVTLINKVSQGSQSSVIIETDPIQSLNEIELRINEKNFDWNVRLEGSQTLNEWSLITEGYRILSIENDFASYRYCTINFNESKFRYYRLTFPTTPLPTFSSVNIRSNKTIKGQQIDISGKTSTTVNKDRKRTDVAIKFPLRSRLFGVRINVSNNFDFYRRMDIAALTDSVQTEIGWKYEYKKLKTSTLSSREDGYFGFQPTLTNKLKLTIFDQDNPPISISGVTGRTFEHEVRFKILQEGAYFLCYGNDLAQTPNYDLKNFTDEIPGLLTPLVLGPELTIDKPGTMDSKNFIIPKLWLWLIIIAVIALVGWATIRMMRSPSE